MKKTLENIEIGLIRFSFIIFCIILFPLLFINTVVHKRQIKKDPFYKSYIVRLYERYPLAYEAYILVMNFPLFYNVYNVLPPLSEKVLQVGCGTGALNIYLKRKGKAENLELYNLDTNINSINFGIKRKAFTSFIHSDIKNAPFEDGFFKTIVFARCLHHIKNHKKVFKECERLLADNGTIIISDHIDLLPNSPDHSYMMNSNIDGVIWRYNEKGLKSHLEKNLPDNLKIKSLKAVRQKCITNYNSFFPNADGLVVIEKLNN
ncbi:class I SAM-dependent methyltransferase [Pedobacter jejuensis]|uniref:Class I SAM-dependent methyltransferase n=1 Tax=Pedobacter jejuensis TaxID=1268550 RepID=A0A3N0BW79_9SPHI|nr:class I SAM-dependent methyltransferase [Pedobacter jejuensis]RNL53967.1 class I SAM-dependent methyltransferase [Pedobacter jejuensis]